MGATRRCHLFTRRSIAANCQCCGERMEVEKESAEFPLLLHLDMDACCADRSRDGNGTETAKPSVLVVGDGDFSYGLVLAKALDGRAHLVVTGFDSIDTLKERHPVSEATAAAIV